MLIEFLFLLVIGAIFCSFGLRIWKFNKINLISDTHYKNISEENRPAYARQMGKGVFVIGVGMAATGVLDFIFNSSVGWFFFIGGFAAGLIIIVNAQKKYNGGTL